MSKKEDEWYASREAWDSNKNINYNKALEEYNQRVADAINDYYNTNAPGYSRYFADNGDYKLWNKEYDDITNKLLAQDIKNMQNYLDNTFGGLGGSNTWLNNYWTGHELDDLAKTYIEDNYNSALDKLDNAYATGYLNDSGYNQAMNDLLRQKSAANVTVGDLSKGIIDNYKADLTNKAQGYLTDLSNYNLNRSNTINTNTWEQDFNNYYNDQKADSINQFNNAVGGLNLFDTSDLIGNAKADQGITNPVNSINMQIDGTLPVEEYYKQYKNNLSNLNNTNNGLFNAIDEQNKRKSKKVGLGNVGLF